jgi:hypothetical protein
VLEIYPCEVQAIDDQQGILRLYALKLHIAGERNNEYERTKDIIRKQYHRDKTRKREKQVSKVFRAMWCGGVA